MSDFISLTCPHCGRVLPIADSACINDVVSTIYTCDSCGVKSILKRDASKFWLSTYFAACPLCNNNDKSVRISTLDGNKPKIDLRLPVNPVKPVMPKRRTYSTSKEFIPRIFSPEKGFNYSKFQFTPRKINTSFNILDAFLYILEVGGGALVLAIIPFAIFFYGITQELASKIGVSIYSLIGAICISPIVLAVLYELYNIFLSYLDKQKKRDMDRQREEALRKYVLKRKREIPSFEREEQARKEFLLKEIESEKAAFEQVEDERMKAETVKWEQAMCDWEKETSHWEKAMSRWDKAYYCGRDDVVFILGTNEYEKPQNFQAFLYR